MINANEKIEIDVNIPFALICEGKADHNFFRHLILRRRLPLFNIIPAHGFEKIERALRGLRADQSSFVNTIGVLIVADSRDDPKSTFSRIVTMIRRSGYDAIPSKPLEIAQGKPNVAVLLVPDSNVSGSLESICFAAISEVHQWLPECIDSFLRCGKSEAGSWGDEKLAKAKFSAAVAVTFRHDPSRAISLAFSEGNSKIPVMISTQESCFDRLADRIAEFAQNVSKTEERE